MSELDELLIKTSEKAKGIADRKNYGDHQKLTAGTIADLVIQEHLADKAGCFIEGTPIQMADGTKKAIETIQVGDSIKVGEHLAKVARLWYNGTSDNWLEVTHAEHSVVCTPNHPFWVVGIGWLTIQHLEDKNVQVTEEGYLLPSSKDLSDLSQQLHDRQISLRMVSENVWANRVTPPCPLPILNESFTRERSITMQETPWGSGPVILRNGGKILHIRRLPRVTRSRYDLEIDSTEHCYSAGGFVVHNSHFDYRIGNSDTGLISWATKHPVPKPGERISLFQQPVHDHDYKDFQGKIESGYGKGEVKTNTLGRVLITKVTPDSLQYTVADKRNPQRYVILKPKGWDNWLLINNTKTKPLPYDKEHTKSIDESQIPDGSKAQPKVDGAAAFTEIGKNRAEVYSYRKHKETGDPIVHTERVFGKALQLDTPKNLRGTVLRGELYGESGGKALEPQDLGGLLNSNIEKSLTDQKSKGVNLKQMIFDIKRFGNKEVSNLMPYSERRKLIEQALSILPKDKYQIAPEHDAKKLLAQIKSGKNPLTQEGIVIHPPTGAPLKVKLVGEHDVYVTGTFSGEGKHEGRRAGGFTYSLQPGGDSVGSVGTGISDSTREQLHNEPDSFKGRVARIESQGQHRSGAHRAPSLIAFHEDKTAQDLYSYVPKNALADILKNGLHSGKSLIENPKSLHLAAVARDTTDKEFKATIEQDLADSWAATRHSVEGPNAVFHLIPEDQKLSDKHPVKSRGLVPVKIDVTALKKDHPETRFYGLEMKPFDDSNYAGRRHHFLGKNTLEKLYAQSPKKYWSTYNDIEDRGLYAPDVPHVAIHTPSGLVPAKYITKVAALETARVDPKDTKVSTHLQRRFNHLADTLKIHGVLVNTGHKRIVIPKDKLTESDVGALGFIPVKIAIPEAGQDRFESFRHPNNNYHIHSHGKNWTMHEDDHASSTMLMHNANGVLGKVVAFTKGLPHVATEGIPGIYYYTTNAIKNRFRGEEEKSTVDAILKKKPKYLEGTSSDSMSGRVLRELSPTVINRLHHLRPSLSAAKDYITKTSALTGKNEPHQQRVIDRMKDPNQRGLVVVHGLGSGKTRTSIGVADSLGMPADVVLPAALRGNYEKEIAKHTQGVPPEMHIQSIENLARKGTGLKNKLMIVDEAHRIRNSGKSRNAMKTSPAEKRLLLTGSLFYNRPADMAGPINMVAGQGTLPENISEFNRRYIKEQKVSPGLWGTIKGRPPGVRDVLNPARKSELKKILDQFVDYHSGSTENFPKVTEKTIEVPMSSEQTEIYDTLLNKAPAWVKQRVVSGLPASKSEISQMNQFLSGTRQVSNTTASFRTNLPQFQPKIDKAVNELQKLLATNPRAKAVVYSNYLGSGINPYKQKLDELKIPYGEFSGEVPQDTRNQMVRDYNDDKIKALLLSSAGGEGLDLKGTRLIQLLEPNWNEEKLKQVQGRGIRYKSHEHLPDAERTVEVQRYLATLPRRGLMEHLGLSKPNKGVDEYLQMMSKEKERLNGEFKGLLRDHVR